ncbi:MAG: hypothetical protein KC457_17850, partial [Myxococcales bacterium]|nr:hypothetical protein [Myxococcales bacterium]
LLGVNRRAVLIDYDREVLRSLLRALERPPRDEAELFAQLMTIRGRDSELDELICARTELEPDLWRGGVERVLTMLND